MCDDTQPGKMIQHIDIESSMEARNKSVSSGMDEVRASLEQQLEPSSNPETAVMEAEADSFLSEGEVSPSSGNTDQKEEPKDSVDPDEFFSEAPLDNEDEAQEGDQAPVEDSADEHNVVEKNSNDNGNESPRVRTIEEFNASIGDDALFPFDNCTPEEHRSNDFDELKGNATSDDIAHKRTADSIFRRMKGLGRKNG